MTLLSPFLGRVPPARPSVSWSLRVSVSELFPSPCFGRLLGGPGRALRDAQRWPPAVGDRRAQVPVTLGTRAPARLCALWGRRCLVLPAKGPAEAGVCSRAGRAPTPLCPPAAVRLTGSHLNSLSQSSYIC